MGKRYLSKWALSLRKLSLRLARSVGADPDYTYRVQPDADLRHGFAMRSRRFKDQIATNLFRLGWRDYEAPVPLVLARIIRQSSTVFVDIGANTGFYSLLAWAAGARSVHAFEPVQEIHDMLAENLRLSNAGNSVELSTIALSNYQGEAAFFVPDNANAVETSASLDGNFRAGSQKRMVRVDTVDHVLGETLLAAKDALVIMKIDVENCEHLVLAGMERTLREVRPLLVLELLEENPHAQAIRATLEAQSYRPVDFEAVARRHADVRVLPENKNAIFYPAERQGLIESMLA